MESFNRCLRLYATFDKRWTVDFTNQFTQQRVRTLHFSDPEKVRDIALRGKHLQIYRSPDCPLFISAIQKVDDARTLPMHRDDRFAPIAPSE
jgi:hypothetical protein